MRAIDPSANTPEDIYKLMIGLIVPRPIAFVSTLDAQGIPNLAPFSYFTACSSNPPVVCFCTAVRSGPRPHKDTLRNIEETGEFVVNIVSEDFAEKMNAASAECRRAVGSVMQRKRISRPSVVGRTMSALCSMDNVEAGAKPIKFVASAAEEIGNALECGSLFLPIQRSGQAPPKGPHPNSRFGFAPDG